MHSIELQFDIFNPIMAIVIDVILIAFWFNIRIKKKKKKEKRNNGNSFELFVNNHRFHALNKIYTH